MYDQQKGEMFPKPRWLCEAGAMRNVVAEYTKRYPRLLARVAAATDEMVAIGRIAANKMPPVSIMSALADDLRLADGMTDPDSRAVLVFFSHYRTQGDLRLWFADEGLLDRQPRDGFMRNYKQYLRQMANDVAAEEEATICAILRELDFRARERAAEAEGQLDDVEDEVPPGSDDATTHDRSEKENAHG